MTLRTFWLEKTDMERASLRRFVMSSRGEKCSGPMGYHHAEVLLGERKISAEAISTLSADEARALHPDWPTSCSCGYEFADEDEWQIFRAELYRRTDTGELMTLRDAPPGATHDAEWLHGKRLHCGPDGRAIHAKCPDGRWWNIDGRASNCTMPDDKEHKCWIRHGTPELCDLTVDKAGFTCAAGAGSIDTGTYHGFLRAGTFT